VVDEHSVVRRLRGHRLLIKGLWLVAIIDVEHVDIKEMLINAPLVIDEDSTQKDVESVMADALQILEATARLMSARR